MSEQNKKLVKRWFKEVWNQGRLSAIPEMYIQSGRAHGFPDPDSVVNSAEEFAEHCKASAEHFPTCASSLTISSPKEIRWQFDGPQR